MRIAYSSISGAYVGIWVAHDAGFFAKEGLEDQIILIPSATQLAQVTVAGDVDVSSLGGGPMIAAALSGADLKVFGNNVNKMIFSLHTKPEVKSVEELRGKRIGVSRFGSSSDVSARYALRKYNLDPQRDVILLQLGSMSNMFGALKSGAVEGSMVSPPTQFLSEKMGFKELLSVTDMNYAYPKPGDGDLGGNDSKETGSYRPVPTCLCARRASRENRQGIRHQVAREIHHCDGPSAAQQNV